MFDILLDKTVDTRQCMQFSYWIFERSLLFFFFCFVHDYFLFIFKFSVNGISNGQRRRARLEFAFTVVFFRNSKGILMSENKRIGGKTVVTRMNGSLQQVHLTYHLLMVGFRSYGTLDIFVFIAKFLLCFSPEPFHKET